MVSRLDTDNTVSHTHYVHTVSSCPASVPHKLLLSICNSLLNPYRNAQLLVKVFNIITKDI